MIAYHGYPALKARLIATMREHREAEKLVKGVYWQGNGDGKGCAVGCLLHDPHGGHARYEPEFGIPVQIAHLEDAIFENLPDAESQKWPEQFLHAIPTGADLSLVWPRFAVWLLCDPKDGVIRFSGDRVDVRSAIERVFKLYSEWIETGEKPDQKRFDDAEEAARAARAAGAVMAAVAARAAGAARAAMAAEEAAEEAAEGAAFWRRAADKLVSLLKSSPVAQKK